MFGFTTTIIIICFVLERLWKAAREVIYIYDLLNEEKRANIS